MDDIVRRHFFWRWLKGVEKGTMVLAVWENPPLERDGLGMQLFVSQASNATNAAVGTPVSIETFAPDATQEVPRDVHRVTICDSIEGVLEAANEELRRHSRAPILLRDRKTIGGGDDDWVFQYTIEDDAFDLSDGEEDVPKFKSAQKT
jgi:hypothetical protein